MVIKFSLGLFICLFTFATFASSNQVLTYQGILTDSSDTPYTTAQSVSFSIYSPSPSSCLLYSEDQNITPDSKGRFSVQIGTGTRTDGLAHPFMKVFVNGGTLSGLVCGSGDTSFSPAASDNRMLAITVGGVTLSPMVSINAVPFALQAQEIAGWGINNLVKVSSVGSPTTFTTAEMAVIKGISAAACLNGQILKWNGSAWDCAADDVGSAPGDAGYSPVKGLIAFDTDAVTSGITVASGVARLSNTGVSANSYGAANAVPTILVNAQGRITNASSTAIALPASQITQSGANNGEVLKWNGAAWAPGVDNSGGAPADSSYAAKGVVQFLTDVATSGINVVAGVANVNTGIGPNNIVKLDGTGKLPTIDGSALTNLNAGNFSSGTLQVGRGGTGASAFAPNALVMTNGTGSALGAITCAPSQILKWNGTAWDCAADATGGAPGDASFAAKGLVQGDTDVATSGLSITSGVIKVNAGTGADQIVKLDGLGKLPAVDGSALTNIAAANLTGIIPVASGGTNSSTALLNNRVMISNAGRIVEAGPMANGQVLVGDSSGAPVVATLGSSNGINVTTGPGTLSIATNATPNNSASTIVSRDASGNFAAGAVSFNSTVLRGSGSGNFTMRAAANVTDYAVTWPSSVGTAGSILTTDASGNLSWGSPSAVPDGSYVTKGSLQGLTDAAISGLIISSGVISVNSGTGNNQIVKLDGSAKLPAVDGSALTNLNAGNISSGVLPIARGGTNNGSLGVTNGGIIYADGSGLMTSAAGTSGQALLSGGAGAPTWGNLTVGAGGTGATSFSANHLVGTNGVGGALQPVTCAQNQVISFDASGYYGCYNVSSLVTGFVDGGNTFAATATLGTNSNHDLAFETNGTKKMTILKTGEVGIGTASPLGKLHIVGDGNSVFMAPAIATNGAAIYMLNSGNGSSFGIETSSGGTLILGSTPYATVIGTQNIRPVQIGTSNAIRMTVTSTGNVGIGTTNPQSIFEINGAFTQNEMAAPSVAPADQGRIYFDSTLKKFRVSENGGAYVNLLGGSGTVTSVTSANADISVAASASTPVLTLNSGTGSNQIVKLDGSAKLPAVDGSALTDLNAANISSGILPISRGGTGSGSFAANSLIMADGTGLSLVAKTCASNEVLKWNGGVGWSCATDDTGAVPVDSSHAAKGIVQFDTNPSVSGINVAGGIASVNAGTGPNKIVKLDGSGNLPAVDGSALTNVTATNLAGILPITNGGTNSSIALMNNRIMVSSAGQIVEAAAMGDGQILIGSSSGAPSVGSLGSSNGIIVTPGSGSLSIGTNATPNNTVSTIVSRDASGNFAAGTASLSSTVLKGSTSGELTITVPPVVTDYTIRWPSSAGAAGTFLSTDATGNLSWISPPSVVDATYATKGVVQGLTDPTTSGLNFASGVISVNYGTSSNQIVKLDGSARLPAVDGSALINLNANQISSGILPVDRGGTGISSGLPGGIPYFNTATAMASSSVLALNGVVLGGGAGAAPVATAAGIADSVLRVPSGGGAPAFGAMDLSKPAAVTGSLAVTNGGTGTTSFTANHLIGTNGSGNALQAVTCPQNQVLSFDVSGYYGCYDVSAIFPGFINGGNTFGGAATLGTNDSNNLNFETSGTTRMSIASSGNVAVGPPIPLSTSKLDVTALGAGTEVSINSFSTSSLQSPTLAFKKSNDGSAVQTATTTGYSLGKIEFQGARGGAWTFGSSIRAKQTAPNGSFTSPSELTLWTSDGTGLDSKQRLTIDQNGKVGIGTGASSLNHLLELRSDPSDLNAPLRIQSTSNSGYSAIDFYDDSNTDRLSIGFGNPSAGGLANRAYVGTIASHPIVFRTNSMERMRIDSSGKVGIGTTAPAATLDVNGYMKLSAYNAAPVTCSSASYGSIALTSKYTTCVCRPSPDQWVSTNDGTTACVWL